MLYKQRSRSTFPSHEILTIPCTYDGTTLTGSVSVGSQVLAGGDVMIDFTTGYGPPWPFKPCTHFTWEFERHIGIAPHVVYYTCRHSWANGRSTWQHRDLYVPFHHGYDLTSHDSLVPRIVEFEDYTYCISQLIEEMCEVIKMPTDLLVFLVELRDISAAWTFVKSKIDVFWKIATERGYLKSIITSVKSLVKLKGYKTLATKPVDTASNELLQYSFGVAPLVREICAYYSLVGHFWDRYEDLIKGEGKPQKEHRVFSDIALKGPEDESPKKCIYAGDSASSNGHIYSVHRTFSWTAPKVAVTMYYRYTLPDDWKSIGGKLGYALKTIGIKPSLGTVWELVPFSFVLDWFYPLGDLFNKVSFDPSRIKVEILDVCASVSHGQHVDFVGNAHCYGLKDTPLFSVTRTDYVRRVGEELKNQLPHLRMPTNFQWLLGGALVWVNKGKIPVAKFY